MQDVLGTDLVAPTGALRRKMPVLEELAFVVGVLDVKALFEENILTLNEQQGGLLLYFGVAKVAVTLYTCHEDYYGYTLLRSTGNQGFVQQFLRIFILKQ